MPDGELCGSSPWQVDLVPASVLSGVAVFAVWFMKTPLSGLGLTSVAYCGLKDFSAPVLQSPVCRLHNANISSVFFYTFSQV